MKEYQKLPKNSEARRLAIIEEYRERQLKATPKTNATLRVEQAKAAQGRAKVRKEAKVKRKERSEILKKPAPVPETARPNHPVPPRPKSIPFELSPECLAESARLLASFKDWSLNKDLTH